MPAVPFHLHPMRHEIVANGPETVAALLQRSARDGKRWAELLDPEAAVGLFAWLAESEELNGLRAVIVNDSHLFAYSVGPLWFARGTWLIEQFFMRVGRGSTAGALHAIEEFGRAQGCQHVLMATVLAADDAALGRLLHRHGYAQQSSQHYKDL